MKFRLKMLGVVLGSLLTVFSTGSVLAQSTQVSGTVYTIYGEGNSDTWCSIQPGQSSCSGGGSLANGEHGTGAVSGIANYGLLKAKAQESETLTEPIDEAFSTAASATSEFTDLLYFPTLPDGTAGLLSATVELAGNNYAENNYAAADGSTTIDLGYNGAYYSSCSVATYGKCTATLPYTGGSGAVMFTVSLNAVADDTLDGANGAPGGTASWADYHSAGHGAAITALTMTANGKKYEIGTASGHRYPQ